MVRRFQLAVGPQNANQIRNRPGQEALTWTVVQGQESASLEISLYVHLTAKIACFNMAFQDCVGECQESLPELQVPPPTQPFSWLGEYGIIEQVESVR